MTTAFNQYEASNPQHSIYFAANALYYSLEIGTVFSAMPNKNINSI